MEMNANASASVCKKRRNGKQEQILAMPRQNQRIDNHFLFNAKCVETIERENEWNSFLCRCDEFRINWCLDELMSTEAEYLLDTRNATVSWISQRTECIVSNK